ncbi:hypothetical protein [Maritimibacter sp. 55A14]|uniref:hypothetical protein n=1 Tax=Maritimibacter sp. 55A14 TaxID=2174844 RepID=UPI0013048DD3|nr:hypothetical protein [Maritimibacter sp. 55A14]
MRIPTLIALAVAAALPAAAMFAGTTAQINPAGAAATYAHAIDADKITRPDP